MTAEETINVRYKLYSSQHSIGIIFWILIKNPNKNYFIKVITTLFVRI